MIELAFGTAHPDGDLTHCMSGSLRIYTTLSVDRDTGTLSPEARPPACRLSFSDVGAFGLPGQNHAPSGLAATHLHFAGSGDRRAEGLLRRGSAVQHRDPTPYRTEY